MNISKPLKIMIINSAREWGGTEKWALFTAYGLAARGHSVYFGCKGNLFDSHKQHGNVCFVKSPYANNVDILTLVHLWFFFLFKNIQVVMPSKQREYVLAGLAAKAGWQTRVIGMFGIDRPLHNLRNKIAFCYFFDRVFVVTKMIIDVLALTPQFDKKKCRVVYVGVQPSALSDTLRINARHVIGLQESDICIMGIGRLAPQKGFDYAIKAMALLIKENLRAKLVLVGGGDAGELEKLAQENNVSEHVIFAGFRSDIPDFVQAADLFWLTSRSEGIPNTMLEAMAAKKPVVSFDISGVYEVIAEGENGILIPFENITMLAEKTAALIADPTDMQRLGEAGYQTVTRKFSMEQMIDESEKEIRALVEGM